MTAVDLPAIRALLAGATPGPWETMKSGMLGTRVVHVDGEWESLIPHEFVTMVTPALHKPTDAAFIAAAPSIVAQLLAVVERVEAVVDEWEMNAGPGTRAAEVFGPQKVSVEFAVKSIRAALTGEGQ